MHTWKDQNSENPHQIFRFSSSIVRDPFCVQIWATNSFWRLRNPLPKLIGVVANYLFPKSGPNQIFRSSTENFLGGVRISSFFFVKGMCWGVQEKNVPAWFPSILAPENTDMENFALSFQIAVCTFKERENWSTGYSNRDNTRLREDCCLEKTNDIANGSRE